MKKTLCTQRTMTIGCSFNQSIYTIAYDNIALENTNGKWEFEKTTYSSINGRQFGKKLKKLFNLVILVMDQFHADTRSAHCIATVITRHTRITYTPDVMKYPKK